MLKSTFQHLKGIGKKKERELWNSGIVSWENFEEQGKQQLCLFGEDSFNNDILKSSRKAFIEKNVDFFAERLSREEHYRIALSFPEQVLFLDIETTGLSIFYDKITLIGWSINNQYSFTKIENNGYEYFQEALNNAKVIVTFNGSLFDLPFVRKIFPDLQIPKTHIDLRFFSKRVGLSGGQKKIEKIIGVKRPIFLQAIQGEIAPLLWHRYCQGDLESFKLLVSYNHADVEGMKFIFDSAIERLLKQNFMPLEIASFKAFSDTCSPLEIFQSQNSLMINNIEVKPYKGKIQRIHFNELNTIQNISNLRVVGIDLTGSEKKGSGWCLLEGNNSTTTKICTNQEIIEKTLISNPNIIAIDSPLSLPKGRISVYDDDPGRQQYGIMRESERILKKRGINVYPSLIQSMQKLTERGIYLANYFRSHGIPVIEVYPGAAQDIMGIPRKQGGIEFLKQGLIDFGIKGEFCQVSISHDELDAITSAIVGLFFWNGYFEALGNEDEEYLIVPSMNITSNNWSDRKIVGISGAISTGKTTVGKFLQEKGFHYTRFSLILEKMLKERDIPVNRENLQKIGLEVNQNLGQRWLCKELLKRIPPEGNYVIDGLRFPEDHAFFAEYFSSSFYHIHLTANEELRMERYVKKGGTQEEFQSAKLRPTETKITKLKSLAHAVITNTGHQEKLFSDTLQMLN